MDGIGGLGAAACVYMATFISMDTVFVVLSVLLVVGAMLLTPTTFKDVKFMWMERYKVVAELQGFLDPSGRLSSTAPVDLISTSFRDKDSVSINNVVLQSCPQSLP